MYEQKCSVKIRHAHIPAILTGVRLYSPFTDWFGTKRQFVWFHIDRKMVNTIWLQLTYYKEWEGDFFYACLYLLASKKLLQIWTLFMCTEKSSLNLVNQNQISECNYHFPIDLAPIWIPIGAKSIGNGTYNPKQI